MAAFKGKTCGGIRKVGCSHLRNAAQHLPGTPPSDTKLLGMNGRSWSEAARMPYSCANTTADTNSAGRLDACSPTILDSLVSQRSRA